MPANPVQEDENVRNEIQYIGLRIAYFRKMRNLTQAQLAELVSINKNYLSHIESGSSFKVISLPLLIKIAQALNVKLSVLVDLEEIHSPKNEIRRELDEMKAIFNELKQLNEDLDKVMDDMDKAEDKRINDEFEKVMSDIEKFDTNF